MDRNSNQTGRAGGKLMDNLQKCGGMVTIVISNLLAAFLSLNEKVFQLQPYNFSATSSQAFRRAAKLFLYAFFHKHSYCSTKAMNLGVSDILWINVSWTFISRVSIERYWVYLLSLLFWQELSSTIAVRLAANFDKRVHELFEPVEPLREWHFSLLSTRIRRPVEVKCGFLLAKYSEKGIIIYLNKCQIIVIMARIQIKLA